MNKIQEPTLLYYPYLEDNNIHYSQYNNEFHDFIKSVIKEHDIKKSYVINPLMFKEKGSIFSVPHFSVNSLDGLMHNYDAEIEPELLNKLYVVLAKCCINLVMKPICVLTDVTPIRFTCFNSKQSEIISNTFADYAGFDAQKSIVIY